MIKKGGYVLLCVFLCVVCVKFGAAGETGPKNPTSQKYFHGEGNSKQNMLNELTLFAYSAFLLTNDNRHILLLTVLIFLSHCLLWGANSRKATVIKPPVLTNGLGETLNIYLWPRSGKIFGGAILFFRFSFFSGFDKTKYHEPIYQRPFETPENRMNEKARRWTGVSKKYDSVRVEALKAARRAEKYTFKHGIGVTVDGKGIHSVDSYRT